MIAHLQSVAGKENAEIAEDALALITRAAEGSVRDAMSLMDQAISHGARRRCARCWALRTVAVCWICSI